ncbi:MAG: ATP-binding protein [Bacteroidia bacterium]
MEDQYTQKLIDHIESSTLPNLEKEELAQIIKIIDKKIALLDFKFKRTQKEKNAITHLLSQVSKDLTGKMEESEEKSKILEIKNQELEEARKIADQANKTKSRFLANMSHEIRTPINGVLGMVQLLELTNISAEQQEYINSLKIGGESLLYVINEILDFSKIEAGKIELEKRPYSIRTDIGSVLDLLAPMANAKGIDLKHHINPDIPEILEADVIRIRQVLNNLIGNGIKFTEEGFVSLSVRKYERSSAENLIHFMVQDTGIGIPKEQVSKLFQPFTQVDASTTRKYGGTGLGLAITARLIKMMGGKIWIESEVDKGSAFHFVLPLETYDKVNSTAIALTDPNLSLDSSMAQRFPLKIMVAEDDEVSQILAKASFHKMGYEIEMAKDGKTALQMAIQGDFDLIFLDLNMPKMGGAEVSKHIRAFYDDSSNPIIIALTANVFSEVEDTCILGEMNDFISKPYRLTDLQNLIAKWGSKLFFSEVATTHENRSNTIKAKQN